MRASALIKAFCPDATLTVAGGGRDAALLRHLAEEFDVDVRFVGAVDPQRMPQLYDEADLLLNASSIDNQPLTILEAFASGLPVVSTAAGDIPAMVRNGDTGWLAPEDP